MYKRILTAVLALTLALTAFSGCRKDEPETVSSSSSSSAAESKADTESGTKEELQPDHAVLDLSKSKKPAVTSAAVNGVFGKGTLTDIYGAEDDDRRFTEEAGLYGCPLRFECDDLHAALISFTYDPEQLHGVVPENFRILHYNERGDGMEYMTQVLDPDSHEVSAPIHEAGVYMLVDEYARRIALGQDISGLVVPDPQDEIYDGEIPYYDESRPFTILIPVGCYGYENIEDVETDEFSRHAFLRIVETKQAFVWVDAAYITPREECTFEQLMEDIQKRLPEMSTEGEIPERTVENCFGIESPDGTKGFRVICTDVYAAAGINPELTYRTICDYYPDSQGGCYEIRAQFLNNVYDPDGLTNNLSDRILDSFTLKEGAGYRPAETSQPDEEEEPEEAEPQSEDEDPEEEEGFSFAVF